MEQTASKGGAGAPPWPVGSGIPAKFQLAHTPQLSFHDLLFALPDTTPDATTPYALEKLCVLAFRVGPDTPNTQLKYTIRLNPLPSTPPPLDAGDEIFNASLWGDHGQTFHVVFNSQFLKPPGTPQSIRFILSPGGQGQMTVADVVLFYRKKNLAQFKF
jgi:hypothetical protein